MAQVVAFTVLALSGVALVAMRRSGPPGSTDLGEIAVSATAFVAVVVALVSAARVPRRVRRR